MVNSFGSLGSTAVSAPKCMFTFLVNFLNFFYRLNLILNCIPFIYVLLKL